MDVFVYGYHGTCGNKLDIKDSNLSSTYYKTFNNTTINERDIVIIIIVRTNQLVQCNQLGKPIIFIHSLSCFSFSIAMNFTVFVKGKLFENRIVLKMFPIIYIFTYTKLSKIIRDTSVSSPVSSTSRI